MIIESHTTFSKVFYIQNKVLCQSYNFRKLFYLLEEKNTNEKYISKIHNRQEKFQANLSALHQILEDIRHRFPQLGYFPLNYYSRFRLLCGNESVDKIK